MSLIDLALTHFKRLAPISVKNILCWWRFQ